MELSRREFLKLGAAASGIAAFALAWDAVVNEGRPGVAEEQPEDSGDEEPPH